MSYTLYSACACSLSSNKPTASVHI